MAHAFRTVSTLAAILTLFAATPSIFGAPDSPLLQPQEVPQDSKIADPKWLDRLPKEDRAAIDELVGFAPPPFTSEIKWLNGDAMSWDANRGKVTIVQSFTTAAPAQRKWPLRLSAMAKDWPAAEVALIALHTPEEAAKAQDLLTKQKPPKNVAIAIDADGEFCDSLGIYKEPVNFVVDRNGVVRFAGLNQKGMESAVAMLLEEPLDQTAHVKQRPREESASKPEAAAAFPPFKEKIDNARDIRGQRAPDFFVDEWITAQAKAQGKVVVIDFWATWCGPCVASIPHMNGLAAKYGDKACIVAISDEKPDDFQNGLKKAKLKLNGFNYALALDPSAKMKSAIQIRGIPHCIVMSKDWVVRWQGHPTQLRPQVLEQIIAADANSSASNAKPAKKRGWRNAG